MKLFILLDSSNISNILQNEDVVLSSNLKSGVNCSKIDFVNYDLCDESVDLSNSINLIFSNFSYEFEPFRNTYFMRVFRPINSIIKQISDLISLYKPDELILLGGSNYKFLTLTGGEGEGEHLLYKSSWLFNSFIYDYFKDEINIQWYNKKPAFIFKILHFVREKYLFYGKIILHFFKNTTRKEKIISDEPQPDKIQLFAFVKLPLQHNHFKNLLKDINGVKIRYLTPIISRLYGDDISEYKIRVKEYLQSCKKFKNSKKNFLDGRVLLKLNEKWIELNSAIIVNTIQLNYILYYSNFAALKRFFKEYNTKKNKAYIISNMTFGEELILLNRIGNEFKIPHYNFQAVAMSKMLFPQIHLADKYFLYANKTYNLYKKFDNTYFYYFPVNRAITELKFKKKNQLVLTLFTQPDRFTDQYIDFLEDILPELNKLSGIDFIIKPHYRQNRIQTFEKLAERYSFVKIKKSTVLPEEIIKVSDFILSISSSVLFEGITLNCPGIIIDFNSLNYKAIYENDICFPEINFVIRKKDDLTHIIKNHQDYKAKFFKRRTEFIQNNSGVDIKDVFYVD